MSVGLSRVPCAVLGCMGMVCVCVKNKSAERMRVEAGSASLVYAASLGAVIGRIGRRPAPTDCCVRHAAVRHFNTKWWHPHSMVQEVEDAYYAIHSIYHINIANIYT